MPERTLILASASPRRRELLALGGWTFDIRPANVPEVPQPGESPADFVLRLSREKARHVAASAPPGAIVIGADTDVALDGRILGKPANAAEAQAMLVSLRGRPHEVFTGLALVDTLTGGLQQELVRSRVPMRAYSAAEIEAYAASGDPLDKAGAYAIQHPSFQPVDRAAFEDCFANVMGLPLCHVLRCLRRLGLPAATDLPAACQAYIPYVCPVFSAILEEPA